MKRQGSVMFNSRGFARWCGFFLAAALLLACEPAWAGKRVALIIGNSVYQNVPPLANPINDGAIMAATLKGAGFDVVDSRHDLSAVEARRALRDFSDAARDADIAVVYYAGHGMEVDGANYLIPVDAKLERDTDVYDEALSLDRVLVAVEPAKQLRLVILDACRDNPFAKQMKRTVASPPIGRGLAQTEPTTPNILIAYSAKAGSTPPAADTKNTPSTAPPLMPSSRNIPTASMQASPNFSSTRSRLRMPASPRPKRPSRPSRNGHGSPPRARKRRRKSRPKPTRKPPSRRVLPPKRPNRSLRIKPPRPNATAPTRRPTLKLSRAMLPRVGTAAQPPRRPPTKPPTSRR